jgi:hypothetical protein
LSGESSLLHVSGAINHGQPCGYQGIATGTIANTGTPTSGDYRIELCDAAGRKWKTGGIGGFPRRRLLAWDLLYRALRKLVGNRNLTPDSCPACDLLAEGQRQPPSGTNQ